MSVSDALFLPEGMGQPHPAPFPGAVLTVMAEFLSSGQEVLDPFAGIGGIHKLRHMVLGLRTVGVEIEAEWAAAHPDTICADSRYVEFERYRFNVVATSCTYANRMADHHEATDVSERITYRHKLGRPLTPGNSGAMQWVGRSGEEYRELHRTVWANCFGWLRPSGLLILNIKDHIRKGQRQAVSAWHVKTLLGLGFEFEDCVPVASGGIHQTEHKSQRVDAELVWVFSKGLSVASEGEPHESGTKQVAVQSAVASPGDPGRHRDEAFPLFGDE